jgi:hypothetical protein
MGQNSLESAVLPSLFFSRMPLTQSCRKLCCIRAYRRPPFVSHYLQSLAARYQTFAKPTTVVRNPWRQAPPVQPVVYQLNKADHPLPGGEADATARTKDFTTLDESAITASDGSRFATSVQLSVDRKLFAYNDSRETKDSEFIAGMKTIEDKMQRIQDELNVIAETVTASVLDGLQKPGGLLAKEDAKIDLISEKLLKLLLMVEQALGISSTRPLSDTEMDDFPGRNRNWTTEPRWPASRPANGPLGLTFRQPTYGF